MAFASYPQIPRLSTSGSRTDRRNSSIEAAIDAEFESARQVRHDRGSRVRPRGAECRLLRPPAVRDNAAMEAAPKRQRRWFQFSLRTLLIGVTVVALLAGQQLNLDV